MQENYQNNIPTDILPNEEFKQINTLHVWHVCPYYMVSTHGRVWSKFSNKFLKPAIDKDGYERVGLVCSDGIIRHVGIHRLVLMLFDPQMGYKDLVCNHKDGVTNHNYIGNLEWCTIAYNTQHAYNMGLEKRGEEHSAAKITDAMAMQIIDLLPKVGDPPNKPIYTQKQIAEMVGYPTTEKMVADIENKVSWKHMTTNIEFTHVHTRQQLYTEEDINKLCDYFETHSHENITMKAHYENALRSIGKEPNENLMDSMRKLYGKKYYRDITANRNFL